MTAPNVATQAQIDAARPNLSTWLAANAGSGKTRVLTDRVARLLLEGVDPQNILCLTYTKAAASEMQNRLFGRLGNWAMLPDAKLHDELSDLGIARSISPDTLREARRLFAQAIETPGGLKIQTIHAFCSSILRRFPLEAGVTPRFAEMDDRAAALLRADILEEMASDADRPLVAELSRYLGGDTLEDLTGEIVSNAAGFAENLSQADIFALFDLTPDTTQSDITAIAFNGDEPAIFAALLPALAQGSTNDLKAHAKLASVSKFDLAALPTLESVFLTGPSAKLPFAPKIGSFPTKSTREAMDPDIVEALNALMERIEAARDMRIAYAAACKTRALHAFARAFLARYEHEKQRRGWLDFDDLIQKTRALLTDDRVAQWVLYRLDGGIDHILVDEAQDTSPPQWQVIERLAQEFTAGEGARADVPRTIFVVGDKKQSIYSFQGADPREFDRMREEFRARLERTNQPLQKSILKYSFRSSRTVLTLVDATFEGHEAAGFSAEEKHMAFFDGLPGRVDLWPVIPATAEPDRPQWFDPVDQVGPDHHVAKLARAIADQISHMIENKALIPHKTDNSAPITLRPVHAGDFLILVQRRSPLFHAIIRECKARALPIAGADRLKIGGELAVRDIAAMLQFLATPEDDLSLATVLKSPFFGFSEQALFRLAHGRPATLWEALRKQAAAHPETLAQLDDLRRTADFLRPYDLIERILIRHDGRRKLLARLGPEAEDGINALLDQALAYERSAVPSVTGFLTWMETDDIEIKRQMESAGRRIRVMTVHAAKGLESPIVILPDTGKRREQLRRQIIPVGGHPAWRTGSDGSPPQMTDAMEALKEKERHERDRLLYVAMTRAEKWLIVAAAGDLKDEDECWYHKIRAAMENSGATPHDFGLSPGVPSEGGLRLEHGDWALSETELPAEPPPPTADFPAFFRQPAPIPEPRPKSLAPSRDLGGAKALPDEAGQDEDAALRRGRQVHRLLEFLAPHASADWPDLAARLLAYGPDAAEGDELALLLDEATRVLSHPALQPIFATDALAEVPVSAALPELDGRRIQGVIDRLVIGPDTVLAVDFKTNAAVPETLQACPDGLLRQMGAYASALSQVYPGKTIETALLWTRNATLMRLPHDLVIGALRDTQIP
ncbi:double-strand break repair helicase AddA [Marimonas lutisalis]|uniref:double-strand break repair helicase AddA n=1 Tax=Marimonas lutisalis TaxID=2545756 RepID=UPI0010F797D6|nr:double-strand break repair helicase AddA [Marimonas lutisalis]